MQSMSGSSSVAILAQYILAQGLAQEIDHGSKRDAYRMLRRLASYRFVSALSRAGMSPLQAVACATQKSTAGAAVGAVATSVVCMTTPIAGPAHPGCNPPLDVSSRAEARGSGPPSLQAGLLRRPDGASGLPPDPAAPRVEHLVLRGGPVAPPLFKGVGRPLLASATGGGTGRS